VTDGLIVNRGLITHKDAKDMALFSMRLNKAAAANDEAGVLAIADENDRLVAKMVVAVPEGWLPEGVSLADADWIDQISQENFLLITAEAQAQEPGKKTV